MTENTTKISGNVMLKVTVIDGSYVDFTWKYVDGNVVPAQSKDIVLTYRNGNLECFLDNWNLYKISGNIEVSKEKAIEIALSAIQSYEYEASTSDGNVTVSNFNVVSVGDSSLSYLNEEKSTQTRDSASTLYPSWYIPLGFDKIYAGGVTGAVIRVWADTGEVSSINLMLCSLDNETNVTPDVDKNNAAVSGALNLGWVSNVVLVTLVVGCAGSYFTYILLFKRSHFKLKAVFLCGLIAFSFMFVIPTVNAYTSKAEVSASYWGQPTQEQTCAATLTSER